MFFSSFLPPAPSPLKILNLLIDLFWCAGRILNRFAKDTDNLDIALPDALTSYIRTILTCVGTLLLIVIITPVSILALIPIMYFYYRVQLFYRASSREMKRLESISKSPIFAHFSETLSGLTSIRIYYFSFIHCNIRLTVACRSLWSGK